eukprot:CAMPEP_0172515676 /NCGR_PEP_ID=MMETSP1066-20121228/269785_1 /TAXON_ID=671091 /ORGANISM="Coscinodiscus wailesii, Strain CCMP2513" /LENGTH=530 /DNA_ID=CAMNT_0013296815 /DNA_START=66 /DNA_END=1658 /DNA_ORIENTATION=-
MSSNKSPAPAPPKADPSSSPRPEPPLYFFSILSASGSKASPSLATFSLKDLYPEFRASDERREKALSRGRLIDSQVNTTRSLLSQHLPQSSEIRSSLAAVYELVTDDSNPSRPNETEAETEKTPENMDITSTTSSQSRHPREGSLQWKYEDVVSLHAYLHFLSHGTLIRLSDLNFNFQDEEYLGGVISFCHDLSRYAVGRAILRDATSIEMARDVTTQLLRCLLKFDFRNGPLRKKYDSVKWALKRLETILYELVVTEGKTASVALNGNADAKSDVSPMDTSKDDAEGSPSDHKRSKVEIERVSMAEMEQIRQRMEHRDALREKVIKRCRDSQKAAKQAIFALHRGDVKRSEKLLSQCEDIAKELTPIIEEEPKLRYGSFTNSLEEYAEAKLFAIWLGEKRLGKFQTNGDAEVPFVNAEEYVGGLCDLTGEVGRYAVHRGTKRDIDEVKLCLATNTQILSEIKSMGYLPRGLWKKMDQLKRSVENLEHMVYELSFLQGSNGEMRERIAAPMMGDLNSGDGDCDEKEDDRY